MDQLTIVPLGISAGSPTRERHVSSLAVVMDGRVALFDCGEGTQYQLMKAPFRWSRIEAIFISHLHGDHLYGLPGLLGTLTLHHHEEPITVYGPPPLREYLQSVIETSRLHLSYSLEIREIEDGVIRHGDGYSIRARALDHSVPSFAFRIQEDDLPGSLDAEKARSLGVPDGPLLGHLKAGLDVTLPDGIEVSSRDVVGPARPGRSIVYCLDTRPCTAAVELSHDASVLIHEATYDHSCAREANERSHSTATEAAEIAARAGAHRLLLTHFSPRYLDVAPLVEEARRIFPATDSCRELEAVEVPRPESDRRSLE